MVQIGLFCFCGISAGTLFKFREISNIWASQIFYQQKVPSAEIIEDDPIDLECSIYRFNKKSLKGSLEFHDGEQVQIRPFTIPEELLDDCMESFTENYANVTALREIEKNAIGETKVKKFHLITITPVR